MAITASPGERRVEVLAEDGPAWIDVVTRSLDGNRKRVEIRRDDDQWVYIVGDGHVARFETGTAERRCPDWLGRVLRELGALDVVVEG